MFGLLGPVFGILAVLFGGFLIFFFPSPGDEQPKNMTVSGMAIGAILIIAGSLLIILQ
jgi:hypothetical protein